MFPREIKIKGKRILYIKWDDNSESEIKVANLRRHCPCALCNSERESQGPNYIPLYSDDELNVKNIRIVGHYAINIIWKDGHSTGIYEFERLRSLGKI